MAPRRSLSNQELDDLRRLGALQRMSSGAGRRLIEMRFVTLATSIHNDGVPWNLAAAAFGISMSTLRRWRQRRPATELRIALDDGYGVSDELTYSIGATSDERLDWRAVELAAGARIGSAYVVGAELASSSYATRGSEQAVSVALGFGNPAGVDGRFDFAAESQAIRQALRPLSLLPAEVPNATDEDLKELSRQRLAILHLAAHREVGCTSFSDDDARELLIADDALAALITTGSGTPEAVVMTMCDSVALGQHLRDAGVAHVICFDGPLTDPEARAFGQILYQSLVRGRDLGAAFESAFARLKLSFNHEGARHLCEPGHSTRLVHRP